MKNTFHNIERINDARIFISLGFTDYLGARVLLNNGLLVQGIYLASTSLEKYFKAILTLRKPIYKKHLDKDLRKAIKQIDPDLFSKLNESFLQLLEKCYKIRYINDLPVGYSIALIQFPSIAELDYSVHQIESQFTLIEDGKVLDTAYKRNWKEKLQQLTENNYLYNGIEKQKFIESTESQ